MNGNDYWLAWCDLCRANVGHNTNGCMICAARSKGLRTVEGLPSEATFCGMLAAAGGDDEEKVS